MYPHVTQLETARDSALRELALRDTDAALARRREAREARRRWPLRFRLRLRPA